MLRLVQDLFRGNRWIFGCIAYMLMSAFDLGALLVLSFSVERLLAILRPLQVRCVYPLKHALEHYLM